MVNQSFEYAFHGVYCFDSKNLIKARNLQMEGKDNDAIQEYGLIIKDYESEIKRRLNITPENRTTYVSPLVIVEESKYEIGLKNKASVEELAAKIHLAKGMIEELKGIDNKNSLKKSAEHYQKLGKCLDSLAGGCSSYEDIAQIMFESEAQSSYNAAKVIQNILD